MQVNIVRAVNDVDIPENDAFTVVIKALLCNGALLVCVMCSLIIDFHGNEACLNFRGALLHCNVEHQHDFVSPGPGGWLLSEGERKCVCVCGCVRVFLFTIRPSVPDHSRASVCDSPMLCSSPVGINTHVIK